MLVKETYVYAKDDNSSLLHRFGLQEISRNAEEWLTEKRNLLSAFWTNQQRERSSKVNTDIDGISHDYSNRTVMEIDTYTNRYLTNISTMEGSLTRERIFLDYEAVKKENIHGEITEEIGEYLQDLLESTK